MSKIRRLSLRGIRNFGDDNEESLIRFSCPLTLILGPNGTGKTTIIEALKYATTGDFPPGSEKGKSFIHDPNLATTGTVRGTVKAEIIDSNGTSYTVCRTIESMRPKKFRTLDSTVTRVNKKKNEKASITNRCADVDAELSIALGVSKSILNYVIFCHQDELNWPFDQGKPLKDRFDEIFDSTKYNKALESIAKLYKQLQGDIRGMNAEKQTFAVLVTEVDAKEAKLEEYKKRLGNTMEKIDNIDKELEPIKQKFDEMERLNLEYKDVQSEEAKKKIEYNMHQEQYVKLKKAIKNIFEGTTEELNTRIQLYESTLKERTNKIVENEAEIKSTSANEARTSNILATRTETVGTLKQQVKDHKKRLVRRNQLLDEALQAYGFEAVEPDVSEIEVKALTRRLEQKIRTQEQEIAENILTMRKQEQKLQKEVDSFRSNYSKIESEKLLKEKEIKEIGIEITMTRNKITEIGMAGSKLKSTEQELQAAKQKLEELGKMLDVNSVKADIEKKIKSRETIETNLNAIDEEIFSLHKLSSITAEFELNKSALQAKEEELENLKRKHGDDIKVLLNVQELQQTKLTNNLNLIHQQLEKRLYDLTSEIQTQERRMTALETTSRHVKLDIEKKQKEIEDDKQKISVICDYKKFDEALLMQSKIVKDLQDKRGIYAYQATAYKEYIKKLSEENPCCPLCHRGFQQQNEATNLIEEMETDIIRNQPDRLKKCEKELKVQQQKYDNMLQLKPVVENIIYREENELKKLNNTLEKTKTNLEQLKLCVAKLETVKEQPEKKLSLCKDITGDIQFWDRCIDEIHRLKNVVDKLQIQMTNAGVKPETTMEVAQERRGKMKTSLKETRNYIEALQLKLNKHNDRLQDARATCNELHEKHLKIQSDMQQLKHLKDKQEDLFTREVSIGETVEKLRENLVDAEEQLNVGIQQIEKTKTENWKKQEKERKSITEGTRRLSDLHKIINEVDSFVNSKISDKLASYEHEIEIHRNTLMEFMNKRKDIEQTINKLKEDIASHEIGKRELLDNMALRKIEETVKIVKQQYQELNVKLKNMNYNEIKTKWERLETEKQALLRQKNMAKGNQEELERTIKQCTRELQKEEYRLARRNHTNKCIELTVQENAISNLKAYSQILDTAMIDYHEERMRTVNNIMRKLWKHIYKGSDTTSIQIRTEPTDGVGTNKRNYNYKLVQTKHGCEMDMRGRCSAGQKVLASIIIRLALAETFCKDCGILALDEPTTNLDEENANSLADTLTKVVELRSRYQKNFQLVIISHDERFLQRLANLNNHKQFHELFRKQNGMTTVKISDFNEPTSTLMHIKDEDDSEEEERPTSRTKDSGNGSSVGETSRKRYNWDDFPEEERPTKKRFCFE